MAIEIQCPKCHGRKTVDDPSYAGKIIFYSGPNGEQCPQVTCITCKGVGHVLDDSSPYRVDEKALRKISSIPRKIRKFIGIPKKEPTLEDLQADLAMAVKNQDYERAAILRDEIIQRSK